MQWNERLLRFRSFWIFPALAVAVVTLAHRYETGSRLSDLLWLIPSGVLLWTLLEYVMHRLVFHIEIRNPALQRVINLSHLEHHQAPRNIARLLVRTGYAMAVSTMLAAGIFIIVGDAFQTAGLMSGIWAGFLYYEFVHYSAHMLHGGGFPIRWQRRNHIYHHFHDASRCFGVTTPLWDYVFRTHAPGRG